MREISRQDLKFGLPCLSSYPTQARAFLKGLRQATLELQLSNFTSVEAHGWMALTAVDGDGSMATVAVVVVPCKIELILCGRSVFAEL